MYAGNWYYFVDCVNYKRASVIVYTLTMLHCLKIIKRNCLSCINLSLLAKIWFHKNRVLRLQKDDTVYLALILRYNLATDCLTLVCFTDLHVHSLKNEFLDIWIYSCGKCTGSFRLNQWEKIITVIYMTYMHEMPKGAARLKLGGHEFPHTEDIAMVHDYL